MLVTNVPPPKSHHCHGPSDASAQVSCGKLGAGTEYSDSGAKVVDMFLVCEP